MAHIKCEPFGYHDYGYGPEFGSMPIAKCDESPTSSEEHLSTFCLWPCPSYERAGTQEVHLGRTAQHISHSPPVPGGELSEKSRQVQQAKRYGTYPDSLIGSVFETTGMVVGSTVCLRVTHMMIDTSAPSVIISGQAADQAGLKITECSPKTFTLANGTKSTYHQLTRFQLYISGIHAQLSAFVDNGNPKHHILLGKPGIKAFSATANFAFGRKKETRWFVAQDETGLRRHKVLLQEDPPNVASTLIPYSRREGLRLATRPGETATQRNSRAILQRIDKKRSQLHEKHGKNVVETSDVSGLPDLFARQ